MSDETKKVLIVDDEPVIRLFLQELFEDEGYETVTAQSISEGLSALKAGDLNLVLTDKNLPDGTGFEIVHAAKELTPPCEAILITGYASLDSAVMALQIGAYDYILKPIEDVDLLLEKARKAIEKQQIAGELAELRSFREAHEAPDSACEGSASGAELAGTFSEAADSPLANVVGDLPQLMKLAELGSLIPMLSHELRQPLAGAKGYVDLLLHKKTVDDNVRTKLECIKEQMVHMVDLVESITGYARVSNGRSIIDLQRPIDRALSIFPALQGPGRYQLTIDIPGDLPPILANLTGVQQIIVNLIKNAKDALDEVGGGSLTISAWKDEESGRLGLRITDTGPGIDASTQERLFQPFFTTKAEGVGTGLGLTICKQIMGDHGGEIAVQSPVNANGGTAFTLTFPLVGVTALAGV